MELPTTDAELCQLVHFILMVAFLHTTFSLENEPAT